MPDDPQPRRPLLLTGVALMTLFLAGGIVWRGARGGSAASPLAFSPRDSALRATPRGSRAFASELTTDGRYRIEWRSVPDPLPLNRDFRLEVRLNPVEGAEPPSQPLELRADAEMPEHQHGMLQTPISRALGERRFEVEGMRFHMPGRWVLLFEVREGLKKSRARVSLDLSH